MRRQDRSQVESRPGRAPPPPAPGHDVASRSDWSIDWLIDELATLPDTSFVIIIISID